MVLLDTEKPSSCVCKPGTFWSHMDDKCTKCHPRCETCYGPTEDDCMSCKPDAYEEVKTCKGLSCKCAATYKINKYTQECVSESECASGTFISFKNECEPCHETCDTCDGPEEEDCLTCVGNLAETPEGACVCSSTDPYQFFDGTDCANCHESCKKCNGPEANDCLSCGPNSVLEVGKDSESGVCKCVANFEKNEDGECVIAFNVVTTCPVGCTHCLEYDYYSCLGCVDGARFTPDRLQDEMVLGYCECRSGTFFDTDKCTKCHETC